MSPTFAIETAEETFDLFERVQHIVDQGNTVEALTPQHVLGLDNTEITRLRQLLAAQAAAGVTTPVGQFHQYVQAMGRDGGAVHTQGQAAIICAASDSEIHTRTRNTLLDALATLAADKNCYLLFAQGGLPHLADNPVLDKPVLVFQSQLPVADSATVQLGRRRMACPSVLFDAEPGDIAFDTMGFAGAFNTTRRIFKIPFQPLKNAVGDYTSAGGETRAAVIEQLIADVSPLIGEHFPMPEVSEEDTRLHDNEIRLAQAVNLLEGLPVLMTASRTQQSAVERLRRDLLNNQQNMNSYRRQMRDQIRRSSLLERFQACGQGLVSDVESETAVSDYRYYQNVMRTTTSSIVSLQSQIEEMVRANSQGDSSIIMNALNEAVVISYLEPVKEVSFCTNSQGSPAMKITLHPVVIRFRRANYLMDRMKFTISLTDQRAQPEWEDVQINRRSPHPHVASSGATCWGNANQALVQALDQRSFSSMAMFVCGWARLYNNDSPYTRIDSGVFPTTNLSPGWHPEVAVSI